MGLNETPARMFGSFIAYMRVRDLPRNHHHPCTRVCLGNMPIPEILAKIRRIRNSEQRVVGEIRAKKERLETQKRMLT